MNLLSQFSGVMLLDMTVPLRARGKKNYKGYGAGHGRPILPAEVRQLQRDIGCYARQRKVAQAPTPYDGPVAVEIIGHFTNKVHCDSGALSEVACDALQEIIYHNDKQVFPLLTYPCVCGEDKLTVRVKAITLPMTCVLAEVAA